jgi:type II secretory pathway pseudopilin PulG
LVELLVVISIIAILAGILLPAVIGAFKKASETQVRTEVKSLETAIKAYVNEYSKFPEGNGGADITYGVSGRDNRDIVRVLRGIDSTLNPRRIVFIEIQENSLDANGNFIDAWDNQYRITVDTSFDNIVTVPSPLAAIQGRNVGVWSLGSAGVATTTNNLIKSW